MYDYRIPRVQGHDLRGPSQAPVRGEPVVAHVVSYVSEPVPNFANMNEIIQHSKPKLALEHEQPGVDSER
jgi:hypothetical protein